MPLLSLAVHNRSFDFVPVEYGLLMQRKLDILSSPKEKGVGDFVDLNKDRLR